MGVERPEPRARPPRPRGGRRSTGPGSRPRAARPGPRGQCGSTAGRAPPGGARDPAASSRAHPAASSARADVHGARGAELGRTPACPVGRRRLVVPVRVTVLEHAEPAGASRIAAATVSLEPAGTTARRERRRVGRRQGEQAVEGGAGGARVVVPPPEGRGAPAGQRSSSAERRFQAAASHGVRHRSAPAAPRAPRGARPTTAGMLGGSVMSRLDFHIEQKIAQRDSIDLAARHLAGRPGWIVEFGLGRGRSYSHLAARFPGREIYCFDRELATTPRWGPPAERVLVGDLATVLADPAVQARFHGPRDPGPSRPRLGRRAGGTRLHRLVVDRTRGWLLPGAWVLSDRAVPLDPAWGLVPVPPPTGSATPTASSATSTAGRPEPARRARRRQLAQDLDRPGGAAQDRGGPGPGIPAARAPRPSPPRGAPA